MSTLTQIQNFERNYLTFVRGAEEYGLEILKMIAHMKIRMVSNTPHYVKKVINLRSR